MKISIIVPVYNVEAYLKECIDSLLNQEYDDYEIIIIDDGSTDQSNSICKKYVNNNSNIKLFVKENSGLSDARNYGIERAKGDYIIFVDSDDYIEKNILSEIAKKLKGNSEILITRLIEKYENDNIKRDDNIYTYINSSKNNAKKWILEKSFNTWPAQKYIVSRKFIKENNLKFKSGFLHEDIEWTSLLCIYGKKFEYFEPTWYYHRMKREGSITNSKINEKRITDVIEIAYDLIYGKYSKEINKINIKEKNMLINRIMKSVYPMIFKCRFLNVNQLDIVSNVLMNKKEILKYSPCFKHWVFSITIRLLGLKNTIKILSIFRNIKE